MIRKNMKGFSLVELMIVISIILVLMAMVVFGAPAIFRHLDNMTCKNNMKSIHLALLSYQNKFGNKYPDKSGDLFLAMLYYTGQLTNKEAFLCPSDKSDARNTAHWVETGANKTAFKFQYPGTTPQPDPTTASIWPDVSGWDEGTFEPWEISYAGRKNSQTEGEENEFYLPCTPADPTPIVSDDTEDKNGEVDKTLIHVDHINVLLSDGRIEEKAMFAGVKVTGAEVQYDLEALEN